jgi:hypothetical protein
MAGPAPTCYRYDVFLSHSSADKPVVRELAEQLRAAGLRVWFDEWLIQPGDLISAKIEEGLEHSAVLLFCMSANAFVSAPSSCSDKAVHAETRHTLQNRYPT